MIGRSDPLFVDLAGIDTGVPDWPLARALEGLQALYTALDQRLAATTATHDLPCRGHNDSHAHCSICCHESVFLTPLEWFFAVDYMQQHFSRDELSATIASAHAIYAAQKERIDALSAPPPPGERDHFSIAREVRFTCPLLREAGCAIYPARELLGRLFGQSFNQAGGIYGCALSGAFFGDRLATLVRMPGWVEQLRVLPLTHFRQVYPYWFAITYPP
jgi:Fe-S-cluster containining protein